MNSLASGAVTLWLICGVPSPVAPEDVLERAPSLFTTLDGIRIHYRLVGHGPAVIVFVHGWTCDLTFWRFQVPGLAGKARLLLLDLPGHGRSDKPRISYTPELFARAVDAVMRDAGVERAVLAGHSNGTPVVREFLRLFPSKTQALVVVEGNLKPFGGPAVYERFATRFEAPDYRQAATRLIDGMMGPGITPAVREQIKGVMLATPQHVMVSSLATLADPRVWSEDRIDVPVLSLLAKSPFWTPEYEAFVRRVAPDVDYQVWDGVGHFLMMEKPDAFNAALVEFLTKRGLLGS